ncbi:deoxyribonuclease V [Amycolatopsis dongchuanensis]
MTTTLPRDEAEAVEIQNELRRHIRIEDDLHGPIRTAMGVDVAYRSSSDRAFGAAAVLDVADFSVVESAVAEASSEFPYVPGLFAFREVPVLVEVLRKLSAAPDVVLCDGNGIAHPRSFGLACHLGLLLDLPTIGVAKNPMMGEYSEPGQNRGDRSPVHMNGRVVGYVLRTRPGVKPIFVSPGHKVSVDTAVQIVLDLSPRYRLPEPIRAADHESKLARG